MRKLVALAAASLTVLAVAAAPASADDTAVTFAVAAGQLSIDNDNASVDLGTATASLLGTTVSGSLGTTTVSDNRASTVAYMVATSSTNFVDDKGTLADTTDDLTIAANQATLYHSVPTVVSGVATVGTTSHLAAAPLTLATTAQNFLEMVPVGSNQVTYSPTLTVTIAEGALAGSYDGTVTQTVS